MRFIIGTLFKINIVYYAVKSLMITHIIFFFTDDFTIYLSILFNLGKWNQGYTPQAKTGKVRKTAGLFFPQVEYKKI